MNDNCKGCEWYGKPYFGITPPCNSCTRNTIQTLTGWEDPMIGYLCKENEELKGRLYQALHRIQLLQMDGEVTIRDLTELVNILEGKNNI